MRRMMGIVLVVGVVLRGVAFGQEPEENADAAIAQKIAEDVAAQGGFAAEKEFQRRAGDARGDLGAPTSGARSRPSRHLDVDEQPRLHALGAGRLERCAKDRRGGLGIPDGPLYYVPFTALVDADGKYLAQHKTVHTVVSATVYGQLRKKRPPSDTERPVQIAAFGNPSYPKATVDNNPTIRSAMKRGVFDGGLQPLPNTEREILEIGNIYPSARTFLGKKALEEDVRALGKSFNIVHLAAHGVADPITPLDSFIALTVTDDPKRQNGLLQAWEIYEHVRLDADLVVLSACQTAFGPERSGEGLISLSRAFQVAGARTVVASLWKIADESTAELMLRFYQHLKEGLATDEALRAAQLEFIEGPVTFVNGEGKEVTRDYRSPYYWAAFQVIGDRQ